MLTPPPPEWNDSPWSSKSILGLEWGPPEWNSIDRTLLLLPSYSLPCHCSPRTRILLLGTTLRVVIPIPEYCSRNSLSGPRNNRKSTPRFLGAPMDFSGAQMIFLPEERPRSSAILSYVPCTQQQLQLRWVKRGGGWERIRDPWARLYTWACRFWPAVHRFDIPGLYYAIFPTLVYYPSESSSSSIWDCSHSSFKKNSSCWADHTLKFRKVVAVPESFAKR